MSENKTNSFNIFPNPANEIITVSNLNNASLITISDVAGKNIIQQKVNNNTEQINISALLPGYYIVSLETSNGITKQPLLKK
ncbi:MAG: T9SS type A sorting domain-containing protein [Bacteroidetes bacterium]|nr:T9SS type A sorting domain-containing protein [Bacteroidota bacterium]